MEFVRTSRQGIVREAGENRLTPGRDGEGHLGSGTSVNGLMKNPFTNAKEVVDAINRSGYSYHSRPFPLQRRVRSSFHYAEE